MLPVEEQITHHDHYVVQHISKGAEVCRCRTGSIVPRQERARSGDGQVRCARLLTELLEEGQIVGSVVVADGIAAQALTVGVLIAVRVSVP